MAKRRDKKNRRKYVELATAILMALTALLELLTAVAKR